jgi:oligopeptide/dipeptide ABC transporter ATP-binding protein
MGVEGRSAPAAATEGRGSEALRIEALQKTFTKRTLADRLARRPGVVTKALDEVSLVVPRGSSLAVVGESGSGKTTLAHSLVGLVRPESGRVLFDGKELLTAKGRDLRALRHRIQLIYQDPYTSLNYALRIGEAIAEPAVAHGIVTRQGAAARVAELMGQVGLPHEFAARRPGALSGGQRQRVAIARALAVEPEILVADEAVSALDVSVQAQVIALFARLQRELGLTLVFVSHQLATVAQLCDEVAIMYRGRIVETGPTGQVFAAPGHGYTAALIAAHPGGRRMRPVTAPAPPAPAIAPASAGCPFAARCSFAQEICASQDPPMREFAPGRRARCHVLPDQPELARGAGIGARSTLVTSQRTAAGGG